jgi:hypothetical protein
MMRHRKVGAPCALLCCASRSTTVSEFLLAQRASNVRIFVLSSSAVSPRQGGRPTESGREPCQFLRKTIRDDKIRMIS